MKPSRMEERGALACAHVGTVGTKRSEQLNKCRLDIVIDCKNGHEFFAAPPFKR